MVVINPAGGDKFDPHQHQAISMVPAEQEANTVVTVLQKGYLIADRACPALHGGGAQVRLSVERMAVLTPDATRNALNP